MIRVVSPLKIAPLLLALSTVACVGTTSRLPQTERAPRVAPPVASLSPEPRVRLVAAAKDMLGQPYRYGGAQPGGFDCSGLVLYAAMHSGIHMPRTAAEQLRTGSPVARRNIQAGDLVFLHLRHKELHVGIAMGPDEFIHSPSSGGQVRIDSLNARTYARAFFSARRLAVERTSGALAAIQ